MNNLNKDFWLQFVASLARKALMLAGTFLMQHGWVNEEQSNALTSAAVAQYVAGAILFIIPIIWTWAKQKYNVEVVKNARDATTETTIDAIKSETLSKHSLISSV